MSDGKQFVIQLTRSEGRYYNFFAYGEFENVLERARLIHKIDLGEEHCVLVFETLVPAPEISKPPLGLRQLWNRLNAWKAKTDAPSV